MIPTSSEQAEQTVGQTTKLPVFISSTYEDLKPYRNEAFRVVSSLGFEPHGMEDFGSRSDHPLTTCLKEVSICRVFIGILGMKYGSIDPETGKSYTRLEYEKAIECKQIVLFYFMDEKETLLPPIFVDTDKDALRLRSFKEDIKSKHTISFFHSPENLGVLIKRDLQREVKDVIHSLPRAPKSVPDSGKISIAAQGTGSYAIGEKVMLSGTNTESNYTYLFLLGPNLSHDGVKLDDTHIVSETGQPKTFVKVPVDTDMTWEYTWNTSTIADQVEPGVYVLWAVTAPFSKSQIRSSPYSTVTVFLKNPYMTMRLARGHLAKGDEQIITGTAEGSPPMVYIWLFGPGYRSLWNPVPVHNDGTFEYKMERNITKDLPEGEYLVCIQHLGNVAGGMVRADRSGPSGRFVMTSSRQIDGQMQLIDLSEKNELEAAILVADLIRSSNPSAAYGKLSFRVENPGIFINPIEIIHANETFSLTGSTNLAEEDELVVEISPRIEGIVDQIKHKSNGFIGSVKVLKSEPYNMWSITIDSASLKPGKNELKVTSNETGFYVKKEILVVG